MFVLRDGTHLFSSGHTILQLSSCGRLVTIAEKDEGTLKDGQVIFTRFNAPVAMTVDRTGMWWFRIATTTPFDQ